MDSILHTRLSESAVTSNRSSKSAPGNHLIRHTSDVFPDIVVRARGSWIGDPNGRAILDFTSSQKCSTEGIKIQLVALSTAPMIRSPLISRKSLTRMTLAKSSIEAAVITKAPGPAMTWVS